MTRWDLVDAGTTVEITGGEWNGHAGLLESVDAWKETAIVLFNGGEDFATIALADMRLQRRK